MAPAAKKSKTAPAPAPTGTSKVSFQRLFGGGAAVANSQAAPQETAPAAKGPEAGLELATPASESAGLGAPSAALTTPMRRAGSDLNGSPASELGPSTTPSTPPSSAPSLSDAQRLRVEENRRMALERKRAREATAAAEITNSADAVASSIAQAPAGGAAVAGVQLQQEPPQAMQSQTASGKASAKASAKATANRPKAKAKGAPAKVAADVIASPAKPPHGGPKVADSTPEKTPPPAQEKRAGPPAGVSSAAPTFAGPEGKFERQTVEHWNQYASLYGTRLAQLRSSVREEAKAFWGGRVPPSGFCSEICSYKQGPGGEVVVIGVLFKELKSRTDVIQLYRDNRLKSSVSSAEDPVEPGCLCSDGDRLFIEDGTMRLGLRVPPEVAASYCCGLVTAVLGTPSADGQLVVEPGDFLFARLPPPPLLPRSSDAEHGPFVALVSGLARPGAEDTSHQEALDRLVDFVSKSAGCGEVRRLIVCGGAVSSFAFGAGSPTTKDALARADQLLTRLGACTEVHVMPGKVDPSNLSLPQLPLHPMLFRHACAGGGSAVRCVSNPYATTLEGLSVLGHAGQPVEDMLRSMRGRAHLDALRLCLQAMHLAPTAPDSLPMPPFETEDPFVMREVPHLFFSGNHSRAQHEWSPAPRGAEAASGTQLVLVPAFHAQPAVVLVSLRDPRDVRVHELGVAGAAAPNAASVDASMSDVTA